MTDPTAGSRFSTDIVDARISTRRRSLQETGDAKHPMQLISINRPTLMYRAME